MTPTYAKEKPNRLKDLTFLQKSCRPCENNSQSRNNDCETRAVAHFARSGRENRLS